MLHEKITLLADECIPHDIISALREAHYTVRTVSECNLQGKSDEDIFAYAHLNQLTLFAFDRGFGDIFRFTHTTNKGAIIVLIKGMSREEMIQIPLSFLAAYPDIWGKLVIIGVHKIRIVQR